MGLTWTSAPGRAVRESGTATGGCTSPGGVMATRASPVSVAPHRSVTTKVKVSVPPTPSSGKAW